MTNKIIKFIRRNYWFFLLAIVIFYVYHGWFNRELIAAGDWRAWDIDSMKEWFNVFPAWENNEYGGFYTIEAVNLIRYPIKFIYGALASLNIDFSVSERLINYFLFLMVAPIGSYKLARYLFKNNFGAIISALCFTINGFIFHYAYIVHISSMLVPYALMPWILLFFIKNLNEKGFLNLILLTITYNVSVYYDTRITYLTSLIIAILILFISLKDNNILKNIAKIAKKNILFIVFTLTLNLFWIIPLIKYPYSLVDVENFIQISRKVFLTDALFNTYIYFRDYYTYPTLLIISIICFLGIAYKNCRIDKKNNFNVRLFIYFNIILFIFLAAGITSPLKNLFEFIFYRIPGFISFRDTIKFALPLALFMSLSIGYFFSAPKITSYLKNKYYKIIVFIILSIILVINLNPYQIYNNYKLLFHIDYNQNVSTFKTYEIIKEYKGFKEFMSEKEKQSVLFLPGDPYYTIINQDLSGINSPESNRPWNYLERISAWRFLSPASLDDSYLLTKKQGFGNLISLIGINWVYLLPENDNWWQGTSDNLRTINLLKYSLNNQSDLNKNKISDNNYIYKNTYESDRISVKKYDQIRFIDEMENIIDENEKGTILNNYIWYLKEQESKVDINNNNNIHDNPSSVKIIDYQKNKITLQINNAHTGDIIDFKQRYNPYWQLVYDDQAFDSIETAYQTNSFVIPADGNIEVVLNFKAQEAVTFGYYVWLFGWLGMIVSMLYLSIKKI